MPLLDALLRNAPIGGDGTADYEVRNNTSVSTSARVTLTDEGPAELHGSKVILGRATDRRGVHVTPGTAVQTIAAFQDDGATYTSLTIDALSMALKLSGSTKVALNSDGTISMPEPLVTQIVHTAEGALSPSRVNILTSGAGAMTLPDPSTSGGQSLTVYNLTDAAASIQSAMEGGTIQGGVGSPFDEIQSGNWVRYRCQPSSLNWYAVERGGPKAWTFAYKTGATVSLATGMATFNLCDGTVATGNLPAITAANDGVPCIVSAGSSDVNVVANGAQTIDGSPSLIVPSGSAVWFVPSFVDDSWYPLRGGGSGGGTQGPTALELLKRTATGVGRLVGLQLETDTDANRSIKALRADATTVDSLDIQTSLLLIKGEAGFNALKVFPDEDGQQVTVQAVQSDGSTNESLYVGGVDVNVDASAQMSLQSATATNVIVGATYGFAVGDGAGLGHKLTYNPAAAATLTFGADLSSLVISQAQDASAAGGPTTIRAQRGFGGFIGGDLILGAGDGGTTGTNAPGNVRVKLGTPVSNISGKFIFELEDSTNLFQFYQTSALAILLRAGNDSTSMVLGGSSGASGNSVIVYPSSYVTIGVNAGYLLISSSSVYYESAVKKVYGTANQEEYVHRKTNAVTTATSGNLDTHVSIVNSTISVEAEVVVRNNSDSLGVRVRITGGLYRNDAGTITTLVAATVNATEGDATEASNVTIGLSWSGSTLQLTYSFANAKSRKVYSKLQVRNGV